MTYSRFLFLAAILLTPILAEELDFFPPYRREIDKPWLNAILIVAILAGCVWRFPSSDYLLRDTVRNYPVKALPYLRQFRPQGRVFNDCLWGGYLIWNVRNIPVFIDSRIDIYEYNGVFADYLDAIGIKNTLGILDKYHIRYVLFPQDQPGSLSAAAQLRVEDELSGWNDGRAGADWRRSVSQSPGRSTTAKETLIRSCLEGDGLQRLCREWCRRSAARQNFLLVRGLTPPPNFISPLGGYFDRLFESFVPPQKSFTGCDTVSSGRPLSTRKSFGFSRCGTSLSLDQSFSRDSALRAAVASAFPAIQ